MFCKEKTQIARINKSNKMLLELKNDTIKIGNLQVASMIEKKLQHNKNKLVALSQKITEKESNNWLHFLAR